MAIHWIISFVLAASLLFAPAMITQPSPMPIVPAGGGLSPLFGVTTVVGSASVTAGNFNAVRVLCPAGTVAIGGGIDLGNVFTMQVTSSGPVYQLNNNRLLFQPDGAQPAPIGWQASAVNHETITDNFKVSVVCAPNIGFSSVVSSGTAFAGSFGDAAADCPVNTVAYSGGIDLGNVLSMTVSSSDPRYAGNRLLFQPDGSAPAPSGWQASGINFGAITETIKVAVICGPNVGIVSVVGSGTAPGSSFGATRLTCPTPTVAVGGGIDPSNVFTEQVSSSGPTYIANSNRLLFQPDGPNPAPVGWQASIVNTTTNPLPYKTAVVCAAVSFRVYQPFVAH